MRVRKTRPPIAADILPLVPLFVSETPLGFRSEYIHACYVRPKPQTKTELLLCTAAVSGRVTKDDHDELGSLVHPLHPTRELLLSI